MAGKAAGRRSVMRRRAAKKEKAALKGGQSNVTAKTDIPTPAITEDDLLAFQLSHFGDDTKPEVWFVDAETALTYEPGSEENELGYYDDGVKRTLTDEQIEMFRHSEIQQLMREGKMTRGEAEISRIGEVVNYDENDLEARSTVSDISSVEDELVGLTRPGSLMPPPRTAQRHPSQDIQSESRYYTDAKGRRREQEASYEERHKRKWEAYVEGIDPNEGSLTHRRIVRELDQQQAENVELDY